MAVNKNFVVKNGLEVNTDLIVADVDAQKVGIGTTISSYLLHVYQGTGIGASSVYVTGISTVAQTFNVGLGGSVFTVLGNAEGTAGIGQSVGVGTGEPGYLLDVRSPVSTGQTALYVQGDMYVTGDINLDDITLDQLKVSGISTFIGFSTFASGINVLGLGATTTTLDVSGVSTFTGSIDANGDVDIDGHTELDDVQVSGIATITNTTQSSNKDNGALVVEGGVGIEKNLFVGGGAEITGITTLTNTVDINDSVEIAGITTVQNTTDSDSKDTGALVVDGGVGIEKNLNVGAGLSVVGFSTFADTVQIQSLTDNRVAIVGAGSTIEDDGNLTFDGGQLEVGVGLSVAGLSTFVGVGTFISDLYVGGDLFISENITLDTNLNILGIATVGTLDVTNYSTLGLGLEVSGAGSTTTTLNVSGVSTFSGAIDANGDVDIDGHTELDDLNVSGVSTFVGVGTFQSDLYVGGDLYISEDVTLDTNLNILGIATIGTLDVTNYADFGLGIDVAGYGVTSTTLNVTGVSTFGGTVDINNSVEIAGITTLQDTTQSSSKDTGALVVEGGVGIEKNLFVGGGAEVTGILTVTDDADFNGSIDVDGHTELDDLRVAGVSTFVGIGTFESDLFVAGNLNVIGDIVYDEVTGRNIDITGIATIGTILDVNGDLDVDGHTELDNVNIAGFSTFASLVDINSDLDVDGHTELDNLNVSGVSTFAGAADFNGGVDVLGHTELDNVNVSGIATVTSLDVQSNFDVYDTQATFHNDLFIAGNLSIGGTTSIVLASDLFVIDKTIVLGITTDSLNVDIANDDSANGGGISIASTEGNPLVSLQAVGVNSLPNTHKKILWSKANTYGIGTTDAWMFNYAVGIGSTLVPNGVRFAVKEIQFTDDTINTPNINVAQNLNVSATSTLGIASVSQLYVSGVSTFIGLSTFAGGAEFQGVGATSTTLTVSGVSTFSGLIDANGDLDVDGHTELDNLNVAGFSTFVGFATFQDYVFIQDGLNVAGVVTATSFVGDGSSLTGTASGLTAAVGVSSEGTFVGTGATIINFASSNGAAMNVTVSGGIATATVTPGVSIGLAIALGG
jgi:enhancing lycopene biosynthesis protein 2